jgi:V8-like Glu-specific endopeptidase
MARRVRSERMPARLLAVLATAVACGALMIVPADGGAASTTYRGGLIPRRAPTVPSAGQAFGGVAAVGALFTMSAGKLRTHFCTASVVHSARGDLAVTAAHCLTGRTGQIAFVPGYADGQEPYGVWEVARVYTDQAWRSSQDPDDDVAFLQLSETGDGVAVEEVTGAEQLAAGWQAPALVQVVGYPDGAEQPIVCANWTKIFSLTQFEFDCGGYTDGTSGGPLIADVSAASGEGTIIGVIGGYEQGGYTPEVSYASVFGPAVAALYESAETSH